MDIEVEGEVVIHHKLVNCLHDGKERLAMTQHLVIIHFGDSEDFVYFITEKGGVILTFYTFHCNCYPIFYI